MQALRLYIYFIEYVDKILKSWVAANVRHDRGEIAADAFGADLSPQRQTRYD